MSDKIVILNKPDKCSNYLVTTAIGEPYFSNFKKYIMPSWMDYCQKFNLGLAIVTNDLIERSDKYYKKANWQKFIVARELRSLDPLVNNLCHLDTDIIISPLAPNIFDFHSDDSISVISLRKKLPYSHAMALRRMAFFRNKYYDSKYPLDSVLFSTIDDLYKNNELNVPKIADEVCSGVFVYNVSRHLDFFEKTFFSVDKNVKTLTNNGDQTHFNYYVLNAKVKFLSYKFQTMWVFEQAMKYSFLYENSDKEMIKKCIRSSLLDCYFLHFAGSWHESDMWKNDNILNAENVDLMQNFSSYLDTKVTGNPVGMVRP
jgi:hypothetical protein